MASRRIILESPAPPAQEVVVRRYREEPVILGQEPIVHRAEPVVERVERVDELTLAPRTVVESRSPHALEMWAAHFAPAIERVLPSRDHFFKPVAVSVEKEQFFRDEQVVGDDIPRRVRVTRRRVTLFGTVGITR